MRWCSRLAASPPRTYLLRGVMSEIFHGWLKWIWMIASAGLALLLLRFVDHPLERIEN